MSKKYLLILSCFYLYGLTPLEQKIIKSGLLAGKTHKKIGQEMGFHRTTISKWAAKQKDFKAPYRTMRGDTPKLIQYIMNGLRTGKTQQQIADETGKDRTTITKHISKHKVRQLMQYYMQFPKKLITNQLFK